MQFGQGRRVSTAERSQRRRGGQPRQFRATIEIIGDGVTPRGWRAATVPTTSSLRGLPMYLRDTLRIAFLYAAPQPVIIRGNVCYNDCPFDAYNVQERSSRAL